MQKKNIESIYRLSSTQEGILYQCLKSPDAGYYHSQFSCRLAHLKDAQKWQQVWANIIEQHAVLRTFFTWEKRDQPLQIVRETVQLPWQSFNWSNDSEQYIEQQWSGLKRRDKDRGFNLSKAPLIRFYLSKISSENYQFLVSFHHILLDGWSQRLLFDQALKDYAVGDKGLLSVTQQQKSKTASFEQFINWLSVQDKQAVMTHWTGYLDGFNSPTLIASRSVLTVAALENGAAKTAYLDLSAAEAQQLAQSAKQHQVTLNNLFSGALAILIANETNQSDVVFGTTVSGRPTELPGCNQTAGMFINTLPMRVVIKPEQQMAQWLKQLQHDQAANLQYSHSSLSDIQKLANLPKSQALFDTILVVENLPISRQTNLSLQTGEQLTVSQVHYEEYSHYPLAILVDLSEGIQLIAIYQSQLIETAKAEAILQQLALLLRNMAGSLDQSVISISGNVLEQTNIKSSEASLEAIHQYIERYANLSPEKLAVQAGSANDDEKLTYLELNQRANRLAHYLINLGFAERSAIAVLLGRGINTVISFLAILKTGAAYVPLDATHPSERIALILSDLHNSSTIEKFAVLTDTPNSELALPESAIININTIKQETQGLAETNPAIDISSAALAYIIYTSGSTGTPKGVMISHRSLINSTLARNNYYPQQPDVFLVLSSLATDSSIAGIYWSLCSGKSLVISTTRAEQDLRALGKLIQDNGVTHLLCIPSLYFLLLENINSSQLSSLNTVIVAGEACSAAVIAQHQTKLPNTQLYNEYGPSEFTVWATVAALNDWQAGEPIPIGKTIANTTAYVLNKHRQLTKKGEAGELYLGGDNLANGYLDDSVKTRENFVPNPFSDGENQSQTLYKTGDLVRYCDDETLEFVGRADNQIKVRGNRLEPEEVESLLNGHPDVLESVVFLQNHSTADATPAALAAKLNELAPEVVLRLLEEIDL